MPASRLLTPASRHYACSTMQQMHCRAVTLLIRTQHPLSMASLSMTVRSYVQIQDLCGQYLFLDVTQRNTHPCLPWCLHGPLLAVVLGSYLNVTRVNNVPALYSIACRFLVTCCSLQGRLLVSFQDRFLVSCYLQGRFLVGFQHRFLVSCCPQDRFLVGLQHRFIVSCCLQDRLLVRFQHRFLATVYHSFLASSNLRARFPVSVEYRLSLGFDTRFLQT